MLTPWTQVLLGVVVAGVLLVSFFVTNSLIPIAAIFGLALMWVVLRNPVYSIIGFMAINVVITLRPKSEELAGGIPTPLDLVLGLGLAVIIAYWIFRIRILEQQPLSTSGSQLSIVIFFIWAAIVTFGGIIFNANPPSVALREILNLLPLLILPLLYERYLKTDSKQESMLFGFVLISGLVIIVANIIVFRSNVAKAFYMYQTGRAALDLAATCLIILAMASFLMERHRWYISLGAILFMLLGILGLVISFTRTLYGGVLLGVLLVWMLGTSDERKNGLRHFSIAGLILALGLIPVYIASRLVRLFAMDYLGRFFSTEHFSTDRSLLARFAEWRGEWHFILRSPIFGYGFGSSFRSYDLLHGYNVWMSFSHNSYLYLIFKTGFVGGSLFIISNILILYTGFSIAQSNRLSARSRIGLRVAIASTALILFGAFTGPTFDSKTPISWLALGWGYIYAVEKSLKSAN
ncbi:MAG: O-antigen ligase family protein [Candidatus Kapaibacterium sp.]